MERLSPFPASSVSLPRCQSSPSVAPAPAAAGAPLARVPRDFWRCSGPCSCLKSPLLQLPSPRSWPCAGEGERSPQMRGLGHSPSRWRLRGSGAGRAWAPLCWGGLGVPLSPPATGGAKTSSYAGMCVLSSGEGGKSSCWGWMCGPRDLLRKSCGIHRVFFGKSSVPEPWRTASAGHSSPGGWDRSPSLVLTSCAHLSPPCETPPPQQDVPSPDPRGVGDSGLLCQ